LTQIVGLSGHSGSGKSTAIDHLCALTSGKRVYLGDFVLAEVARRGLPQTRESEQIVRVAMREENGNACLVAAACHTIQAHFDAGHAIFIDAIFAVDELLHLRDKFGDNRVKLLRLEASFEVRAERLRARTDRPFSAEQLKERDEVESSRLGTMDVFAQARHTIPNEGNLDTFRSALTQWWSAGPA
jgi:dephospho-CoA kinase